MRPYTVDWESVCTDAYRVRPYTVGVCMPRDADKGDCSFFVIFVSTKRDRMNQPHRRLPITTQSFEKLRNQGDLYVDKTQYIEKLFSLGNVFFLSRPHRFGKSLFLSTLRAYFEGKKELFQGLYIEKAEEEIARLQRREPWEDSPVLYIELNAEHFSSLEILENCLETHLVAWEARYGSNGVAKTPAGRFRSVVERAYEQTKRQVVILIDEYDKPLLETVNDEALNQASRSLLKAFYEVLKQCDRYIRFAFLTGITKFSKTTLFSGVNNLFDLTLEDDYAGICGFTEGELDQFAPEIERLAEKQKSTVEKTRARLRKGYDGYSFSRRGERVYNPFSLLRVLANGEYNHYWFESGTPTYVVNYIVRNQYDVPNLEKGVEVDVDDVQNFRYGERSTVSLLFQSGYLTVKKFFPRMNTFFLGFPNEEVRYGFMKSLLPIYSHIEDSEVGTLARNIYRALLVGNLAEVMSWVDVVLAGIQYGNLPSNEAGRPLREYYYQSVLYVLFFLLGMHVQVEEVCAAGRIDMVVRTTKRIYIFEFKVMTAGTAEEAIEQIKAQGYHKKFLKHKRPIHLVGVSFDEKTRNIGAWKEEVLGADGRS